MKLINKTILYYFLISIPLLIIAAVVSYFMIKNELRDGMDENLEREKLNVQRLIESLKEPANTYLSYDSLSFIRVTSGAAEYNDAYTDTSIYYKKKKEFRGYRMLRSSFSRNGVNYRITLSRTTIEEDELIGSLFSAFALIIGFLVISFFIAGWLLSKNLWKPFYKTIAVLDRYHVKEHSNTYFQRERTEEFNRLNEALNKMTGQIYEDFVRQKEFTENASHEMQTPLAVIRADLSLLMQSEKIGEEEMNWLQSIENTIKKLTALNKALILLSKIENKQYSENQEINLKEKLNASLEFFEELAKTKHIKVNTHFQSEPVICINPVLADVLVSNLLQNAIRHNRQAGSIDITLEGNSLSVSNTGERLSISEEDLFTRFKKNDASGDSLGLGLSIVKSIVQLYGMQVHYNYFSGRHLFTIKF